MSSVQLPDTPHKREYASVTATVPLLIPWRPSARALDRGSPRWVPWGCGDLELQVPLTLAVSARVARGTVAVAGADVEMSVVPAAHTTWVPGDLWSDKEGTLREGPPPGGCRPGIAL